jgi:3-hydroxyacyl-[acyl-carrier-protein] dehydratase
MTSVDAGRSLSSTVHVDPADPVFAGHYPGFPVLPGMYLVEYVHEAVSAACASRTTLLAMDRARFLKPVRPGDELRIEAALTLDGTQLRCVATVFVRSEPVAEIRLRYRAAEQGGPQ